MSDYRKVKNEVLTERQAKFVAEYCKHGIVQTAALAAGFPKSTASQYGARLMRESPAVMAAIAAHRKDLQAQGKYNLENAMKEADEAIEFARETENANAYVKALELKSKLNGLLVEKHDHRVASFRLNIGGINDEKPPLTDEQLIETTSARTEEQDEEEDIFS